jgi:predicted RNA-binding protein with PUA-like domain
MAHWLFKTEPHVFSIADLQNSPNQTTRWDGVRNYQARNFLRDQIAVGDQVFVYHSQCKPPGIVGLAEVVVSAYADPAQFNPESDYFDPKASPENPRWFAVDIQHRHTFTTAFSLQQLKIMPGLENMVLLKQGRLSIQPVSVAEARVILDDAL